MIAYDFDGVLIPDVEAQAREHRIYIQPYFRPNPPFVVISGRNWEGAFEDIQAWFRKFLKISPDLHCAPIGMNSNEYKLETLNLHDKIDTYIESDLETIAYLASNLKRKVRLIHFGTMIQQAIVAPPRKIVELTYDAVERMCLEIASRIKVDWAWKPDCVIAVVRGGIFPAQIIAEALKLPVGVYYPGSVFISHPTLFKYERLLFVDDEVGLGKTYRELKQFLNESIGSKDRELIFKGTWRFVSVICDSEFEEAESITYGIKAEDWIVLPWRRNNPGVMEKATGVRTYNR